MTDRYVFGHNSGQDDIECIDFLSAGVAHEERRAVRGKAAPGAPPSVEQAQIVEGRYKLRTILIQTDPPIFGP